MASEKSILPNLTGKECQFLSNHRNNSVPARQAQSVPEIVSIPLGRQGRAALEVLFHQSTPLTRGSEVASERFPAFLYCVKNKCHLCIGYPPIGY